MNKRRIDIRGRLQANRTRLLKALKRIGATHVTVAYSGSGDSGQVDQVEIFQGETKLTPKRKVSILIATSFFNGEKFNWVETVKLKLMPLSEALEQLVYDWSESEHAGWKNNDGASGECTIDIAEDQFLLNHTTYYTESDTTEHSL